jgi:tol-pal system protein YbgF
MELDQRLQAHRTPPPVAATPPASAETPDTGADSGKGSTEGTGSPPRPTTATTPPPNDSAVRQAAYQKAFNLLKDSKYPEAIKELKAFIAGYPGGEFSDNAWYWLGEAQYVSGDRTTSRDTFREMIRKFPQSGKVADALLKIAYIEYDGGQYANARELLGDVIKRYPTSSAARMAEKRLEKIKAEKH